MTTYFTLGCMNWMWLCGCGKKGDHQCRMFSPFKLTTTMNFSSIPNFYSGPTFKGFFNLIAFNSCPLLLKQQWPCGSFQSRVSLAQFSWIVVMSCRVIRGDQESIVVALDNFLSTTLNSWRSFVVVLPFYLDDYKKSVASARASWLGEILVTFFGLFVGQIIAWKFEFRIVNCFAW